MKDEEPTYALKWLAVVECEYLHNFFEFFCVLEFFVILWEFFVWFVGRRRDTRAGEECLESSTDACETTTCKRLAS